MHKFNVFFCKLHYRTIIVVGRGGGVSFHEYRPKVRHNFSL